MPGNLAASSPNFGPPTKGILLAQGRRLRVEIYVGLEDSERYFASEKTSRFCGFGFCSGWVREQKQKRLMPRMRVDGGGSGGAQLASTTRRCPHTRFDQTPTPVWNPPPIPTRRRRPRPIPTRPHAAPSRPDAPHVPTPMAEQMRPRTLRPNPSTPTRPVSIRRTPTAEQTRRVGAPGVILDGVGLRVVSRVALGVNTPESGFALTENHLNACLGEELGRVKTN
ncbi:hypothetical protein C8J57DRAFT_1458127 [Mycena rebaudengoi]|nr:hypothetical protein C8J57DRAFT_1458127 [Mycena rebaudengoi]